MSGSKYSPSGQQPLPDHENEKARFKAFLKNRGLKLTNQRRAIFDAVFSDHGHLHADEIADRLRKLGNKASRATVYRTLDLLVEAELVKAVRPGTSQMYYEHVHTGEHHDHLVCVECSEIFEFYSPEIEETQNQVCVELDFTPHKHTMVIYGVCSDCRKKKK